MHPETATSGKRWVSSAVSYVPVEFHIEDKWPFLGVINIKPKATCVKESDLAAEYQCFFGDEWSMERNGDWIPFFEWPGRIRSST
jgi:hypothetical protein